jgi:hypothetical protein
MVELCTAGSTNVERTSREGNLAVESEEKRQRGRPGIKQVGSTKMNLKKVGCKGQEGPGGQLLDQLCDYQLFWENSSTPFLFNIFSTYTGI